MTLDALIPERLFDGETLRSGVAALIADGAVVDVIPAGALPSEAVATPLPGLLAPGFVDVQVNGGGGALLNATPTPQAVATIARAHRRFGTTGLLPTVITDRPDVTRAAVEAVRAAIAEGAPGVLGVHVEGPFINPARKGVHDPAFMRAPDADDLALLTGPGLGAVLVTLAPEAVPDAAIARLVAAGVRVAAGHTEASAARLAEARALGLSGYTHLFNAMPPLQGRAPGPVGAALSERETFCGLIADLHHVAPESLKAAILAKGRDRAALVTDAMSTVGTDLDGFTLQGRRILRGGGRLTTEDGVLAGSDLDMATAVRNAVRALGVPLEDALVMASLTPARWLGLDHRIGRIAPGYRADLVLLDGGLEARATWIGGARENS
ncbi:N-acetylglucosamine-6-phosphate deacetylase [Methylopila jiangsuensis]|uniref:N-acetylglucosamine-6-phosphate deacetylase n=1 Tax=Methylopila jiangsuensis TaxID=586230 RepID=A0A9W6N2P7_9HYPH|nr:N-acetylglucosamine-6-phosphate deacetylase [Methylopila jiangsuensis]MDR6285671.1 N-acetylglucosamine-6-phosphate deacetylase [Methylopila jiangsuensis]GLK75431.1 N-acetylglucosamine-6-phosphate deacetylase [Methylopila jiangsuensis]